MMIDSYTIEKIDFKNKKFNLKFLSNSLKISKENLVELECDSDKVTVEEIESFLEEELKSKIEFEKNKIEEMKSFLKEKEGNSVNFYFKKENSSDEEFDNEPDIEIEVIYYDETFERVFLKPFCKKFKKNKEYYKFLTFSIYDLIILSNERIDNVIYKKCEQTILEYLKLEEEMEDVIFDEKNIVVDKELARKYEINFVV